MRSTSLQNQLGLGHRLADCGVVGISSIFWVLNRIFLTPRSVRIGLSGLVVWVGAVSVCVADPGSNLGGTWRVLGAPSTAPSGAIKDPFHPQGYLLELADKMGPSRPGNAVLGAKNLNAPRPVASTSASSRPTTTGVTWLTPSTPTSGQPVTSQPIMSPPAWLSSSHQTTAKTATPEIPLGQVRWLTPAGPSRGTLDAAAAPKSNTAPATGTAATKETIRDPLPPATVKSSVRWLPSGPPAVKTPTPVTPAPAMSHANWLPSGDATPRTVASANAAMPTSHATWLPASKPVVPERTVDKAAWPAPDKHFARESAPAQPAPDSTTWLSPENGAAQRALAKMAALKASKHQTTAAKTVVVDPIPALVTKQMPKAKPRQLTGPHQTPAPQMPRLSRNGAGVPATGPIASPVMYAAMDMSQAKHFFADPSEPKWSLGADLDKYRNHAVQEGARNSGQSLQHALGRIGLIVEDTTNVITLGYASDRALPFRKNDGKGLIDDPTRVPKQAGDTVVNLGDGLYSIADLVTLNALPDHDKGVYQDNHPLVRPLVFTGRTIGGVWKTTEEIGNAVTWGYFDNVTGSIGMCIEDLIEILKHAGQAVTNLARVPVQLIAGDKKADKTLDWVLLVPLEFASNVLEMKGIANMDDYETAFADKGVIGSILEFGGSTFIVYRAIDELVDELKDDDHRSRSNNQPGEEPTPEPPVTPPDPPVVPTVPSDWGVFLWSDGQVWTGALSG